MLNGGRKIKDKKYKEEEKRKGIGKEQRALCYGRGQFILRLF